MGEGGGMEEEEDMEGEEEVGEEGGGIEGEEDVKGGRREAE